MTYSYATKSWVLEHMNRCLFGRETLAKAAWVEPRTISSWYRQERTRTSSGSRQCNEYERGMAICLYKFAPKHVAEIAKVLGVSKDTIWRFVSENRITGSNSDLIDRTSDALAILEEQVMDGVSRFGADKYIKSRELWPSSYQVFYLRWEVLDYRLHSLITNEVLRRNMGNLISLEKKYPEFVNSGSKTPDRKNVNELKIRLAGPHKFRGSKFENGEFEMDPYVQANRQTGLFAGYSISPYMHQARIADYLMAGVAEYEPEIDLESR